MAIQRLSTVNADGLSTNDKLAIYSASLGGDAAVTTAGFMAWLLAEGFASTDNLKTVGGQSLVGQGDLAVPGTDATARTAAATAQTTASSAATAAANAQASADAKTTPAQVNTAVGTAVTALVGTAPTTLNTLGELAAALGNDPSFAASMATAIAANLAKPTNAASPPTPGAGQVLALVRQNDGTSQWMALSTGGTVGIGTPPAVVSSPTLLSAMVGVSTSASGGAYSGSPAPAFGSRQYTLDGAPISGATAASYTPVSGDVGHLLRYTETYSNASGSVTGTSNAVTVAAAATGSTMAALGYIGTNAELMLDYGQSRVFVDVVTGARGFQTPDGSAGATLDANGWPTVPWLNVLSASNGNCPVGTYTGQYQLNGNTTHVTATGSCTLTETSTVAGLVSFTLTATDIGGGKSGNVALLGPAGITGLTIVRSGYSIGTSTVFMPDLLAFYAQINSIRFMKCQNIEAPCTDGTWASRPTPTNLKSGYFINSTQGYMNPANVRLGVGAPLETLVALANAIKAVAGSNFKTVHFCFSYNNDDTFVTNAATLITSTLSTGLSPEFERGNEVWNFSYPTQSAYYLQSALTQQLGFFNSAQIASIAGNGVTTTVTLQTGFTLGWGANGSTRTIYAGVSTAGFSVNSVTATVISPTSFSYPSAGNGAGATASAVFIGSPTTGLCYDGNVDLNLLRLRAHAKRTYQDALLIEAVTGEQVGRTGGTKARMILGAFELGSSYQDPTVVSGPLQTYGSTGSQVLNYLRATFTTRAVNSYLWSVCVAPYPSPLNQPGDGTSLAAWQSDLAVGIANQGRYIQAWYSLCKSLGVGVSLYESAPTLPSGWGDNATNVAFQLDASMAVATQNSIQLYANSGVERQQYFCMAISDFGILQAAALAASGGSANSNDSFGWQGTDTNTLVVANQRPKVKGLLLARDYVPTISLGQNVVGGAVGSVSAVSAAYFGRQDDASSTIGAWAVSNTGNGNVGFFISGSTTAFGTADRWIELVVIVNNAGTYTLNLWAQGPDVPNPAVRTWTMQFDGGTAIPYVANFAGSSAQYQNYTQFAIAAGASEVPVTLTAGPHILRITVPFSARTSGAGGTDPNYEYGVNKVKFTRTA